MGERGGEGRRLQTRGELVSDRKLHDFEIIYSIIMINGHVGKLFPFQKWPRKHVVVEAKFIGCKLN